MHAFESRAGVDALNIHEKIKLREETTTPNAHQKIGVEKQFPKWHESANKTKNDRVGPPPNTRMEHLADKNAHTTENGNNKAKAIDKRRIEIFTLRILKTIIIIISLHI